MPFALVDAATVPLGRGPHPAISPYDRRVSEQLDLKSFEVYRVELPPGAETVPHDHREDKVEDMYAFVEGTGWLVVDGREVSVTAGEFASVSLDETRYLRAGRDGLVLIAVCGVVANS
jgi:mannose-6-phosphate isomerase-like protein (cupin superfamily)